MTVRPLTASWGGFRLFQEDPAISVYEDVVYVPMDAARSPAWGVFDTQGRAITECVTFQGDGEERKPDAQVLEINLPPAEPADDETYIYCGKMIWHFGHFIVDFIPRLWPIMRGGVNHRLLFHEAHDLIGIYCVPFVGTLLTALDLSVDAFIKFDTPKRIRKLIVPHTSMSQQAYVHGVLGEVGARVARRLVEPSARSDRPVYLSKSKLAGYLQKHAGEADIEAEMLAAGVEIVHPETLSITEQINLFSSSRKIFGSVGSALHSSLFARPQSEIYALNGTPSLNTNYRLLDAVSHANTNYFFDDEAVAVAAPTPIGAVATEYRHPDPARMARELLTAAGVR